MFPQPGRINTLDPSQSKNNSTLPFSKSCQKRMNNLTPVKNPNHSSAVAKRSITAGNNTGRIAGIGFLKENLNSTGRVQRLDFKKM